MTGRTVTATLRADIAGYVASMNKAAAATRDFGAQASKHVEKNKESLNSLSRTAGLAGIAVGAGYGIAVNAAADFDQAMSKVAATGQDAKSNLDALRAAAIDAGQSTAFSASEAADGIESLAKAGVSAKDTLGGGLKGALDLAAAGGVSVGDAADTAATAMTQFGLAGNQVPHIADLIAAGAGKAQGEVGDLAAALKQSGLVASQFGLSIEDTTGTLAAFASAGLTGSDAGTSFKTMLLSLASPSSKAQTLMDKLGISAYDAQGKFVGITDLAQQLKDKLGPLSEAQRNAALSTIFGSDAIRSANVLYQQGGAGIDSWKAKVNDAGYAADTARTRMDNLRGDLETLKGTFETAFIGAGEGAQGPLRDATQAATGLVEVYNKIPAPVKSAGTAIAGVGAAGLLGVAGLTKVATKAQETKAALTALGISGKFAGGAVGVIGVGVTLAGLALAHYAEKTAESKARTDDLTQAFIASKGAIDASIVSMRADSLEKSGALQQGQQLGLSIQDVTKASLGQADAIARVNAVLDRYKGQQVDLGNLATGAGTATNKQAETANHLRDTLGGLQAETHNAADAADRITQSSAAAAGAAGGQADAYAQAGAAIDKIGNEAQQGASDLQQLAQSLFAAGNAALSLSNAELGFHQSITAATQAVKQNGRTFDQNTAKGQANRSALYQLAGQSQAYVQQLVQQGASTKRVGSATDAARSAFVAAARQMGLTKAQAGALANQYGLIPKNVKTAVSAPGATSSKSQLEQLKGAIANLPKSTQAKIISAFNAGGVNAAKAALASVRDKTVTIYTREYTTKQQASGHGLTKSATGGYIRGPGTAISDSIPAMLSDGEFVVRAAAVRAIGLADLHRMNAMGGPQRAYASGGLVSTSQPRLAGADYAAVRRLIAAIENPVGLVNAARAQTVRAQASYNQARKAAIEPTAQLRIAAKANDRDIAARNRLRTEHSEDAKREKDRIARLEKRAKASKGVTKADRDLAAARRRLSKIDRDYSADLRKAEDKVAASTKVRTKAQEKANAAAEKSKAAAQALAEAQKNLADQQKAVADSARQIAETFRNTYVSQSTDVRDWIDLMKTGARDIIRFTAQIARLRKMGLSETIIQQIIGMGAVAGGQVASQLLASGGGLIKSLNDANSALQTAADNLGYTGATGAGRYATGGYFRGAGSGVSDSNTVRISNGEYIVNAAATAANRGVLDAMNYGRAVVSHNHAAPGYARGGYVQQRPAAIDLQALRAAMRGMTVLVQNPWTGEYMNAQMSAISMKVLKGETAQARLGRW